MNEDRSEKVFHVDKVLDKSDFKTFCIIVVHPHCVFLLFLLLFEMLRLAITIYFYTFQPFCHANEVFVTNIVGRLPQIPTLFLKTSSHWVK